MEYYLVLASQSPRRRKLLLQAGIPHTARSPKIEERSRQGETAKDYVLRLSQEKSLAFPPQPGHFVLAADTVVVVFFAELTAAEVDSYVASGEAYDKAGAYGIQGLAAKFINRIEGCYFNVVGLPLHRVHRLLSEALKGETLSSVSEAKR